MEIRLLCMSEKKSAPDRHKDTAEAVGRVGALAAQEPLFLHERPGLFQRSVQDLLSILEEQHLVKKMVDAVSGLVESDDGGESQDVGERSESLGPVKGSACWLVSGFIRPRIENFPGEFGPFGIPQVMTITC